MPAASRVAGPESLAMRRPKPMENVENGDREVVALPFR